MPRERKKRADTMRAEYDFSAGTRGRHHADFERGTNVAFLDPDLVEAFPDSLSVNRALRLLLELARQEVGRGDTGTSTRN